MSVIVLINIIVPVYASAADVADNNSSVYIGNGYVVYYDVKSSWGNNQNIEIKIKNTFKSVTTEKTHLKLAISVRRKVIQPVFH